MNLRDPGSNPMTLRTVCPPTAPRAARKSHEYDAHVQLCRCRSNHPVISLLYRSSLLRLRRTAHSLPSRSAGGPRVSQLSITDVRWAPGGRRA